MDKWQALASAYGGDELFSELLAFGVPEGIHPSTITLPKKEEKKEKAPGVAPVVLHPEGPYADVPPLAGNEPPPPAATLTSMGVPPALMPGGIDFFRRRR